MARQPDDNQRTNQRKLRATSVLIRELALLLDETSLTEIEIERAACGCASRATSRCGSDAGRLSGAAMPGGSPPPRRSPIPQASGVVPSPMVGTAYRAPSPAPAVRRRRSKVIGRPKAADHRSDEDDEPDSVATRRNSDAILVENGQPVEFGEPLVIIE